MNELTKIVNINCQNCGNPMHILASESSKIVAVRCSVCYAHWIEQNKLWMDAK